MALDAKILSALLNKKLTETVGAPENVGHTPERIQFCNGLAEVILDYIKTYAEVVVPDHESQMTAPNGSPVHSHLVKPIHHKKGKII